MHIQHDALEHLAVHQRTHHAVRGQYYYQWYVQQYIVTVDGYQYGHRYGYGHAHIRNGVHIDHINTRKYIFITYA